ncbi:MAG: hypothetical protein VB852_01565 [Deltaproteobacteria bacterium]
MATRSPNSPTYKAAFSFVAESGDRSTLYDAGDFSPYAIESLVDTLRGESRKACRSLELTLEIGAPCSASTLAQLRRRFRTVSGRDVTVRIITTGH